MDAVLTVSDLHKRYGSFDALNGLSMCVPKGAIYGFVGRNGAGKTTLIRLICGLQLPTSGTFTLYGTDSRDAGIRDARRRMGAVIEGPALYSDSTAEENLRLQFRLMGRSGAAEIPELLKLVGLEDTGRKKVKQFSLGMKQRLGIAVALAGNPEFLVLDEPINGLDPQGIIEIRELILRLNREKGITLLISSHILDELSRVATHYGFIHKGRMVREMSAEELEAALPRCVRVEVTDTQALGRVLEALRIPYRILSATQAELYEKVNVSKLTLALAQENCELVSLQEQSNELESYFIHLIGGEPNA